MSFAQIVQGRTLRIETRRRLVEDVREQVVGIGLAPLDVIDERRNERTQCTSEERRLLGRGWLWRVGQTVAGRSRREIGASRRVSNRPRTSTTGAPNGGDCYRDLTSEYLSFAVTDDYRMSAHNVETATRNKMGLGIVTGAGVGIAVGVAVNDLAVWMAVGAAMGVALGVAWSRTGDTQ